MADAVASTFGKHCSGCRDFKSFDDYGLYKGKPRSSCKVCRRAESARWREKNPEYRADYYAINAASENARSRPDKKAYYEANKARISECSLAYAKRHPEKYAARAMQRLAQKAMATPPWADQSKIQVKYEEAARLTRESGLIHHVDHLVPLISPMVCGLHVESNLRVVTARENLEKSNRYWPDMP